MTAFDSGNTSKDYADKLLDAMWEKSDDCRKASTVDLTEEAPVIALAAFSSAAAAAVEKVGTGAEGTGVEGGPQTDPAPLCDCQPAQMSILRTDDLVSRASYFFGSCFRSQNSR